MSGSICIGRSCACPGVVPAGWPATCFGWIGWRASSPAPSNVTMGASLPFIRPLHEICDLLSLDRQHDAQQILPMRLQELPIDHIPEEPIDVPVLRILARPVEDQLLPVANPGHEFDPQQMGQPKYWLIL